MFIIRNKMNIAKKSSAINEALVFSTRDPGWPGYNRNDYPDFIGACLPSV